MKDFDTFSFKAPSQASQSRKTIQQPPLHPIPPKNWREMTYRFQKPTPQPSPPRQLVYENHYINQKIRHVDEELSENIRRRIELEKQLYKHRQEERQQNNQEYFKTQNAKSETEAASLFANMQKKTDKVQKLLEKPRQKMPQSYRPTREQLEEKPESIQSQTQKLKISNMTQITKTAEKQKTKIIPNQVKVQELLKKATFPELPKTNLEKLHKQIYELSLNSEHSDIAYMLMVVNFHMGHYNKVRKYFREIQMFKVYQPKAYWIACQTQYELQGYELCIKLADICMKQLADAHFPRFLFLQARCYEKIGNYVNSIVCYNQLLKIRPKVAELYLERAMIYDKIGYPREAKEDYCYFGILEPQAHQYLKEKILQETNQVKRKQLIKALAKIS